MGFQVNFGVAASLAPPMSGRRPRGFLVHGLDRHLLTLYEKKQHRRRDVLSGRSSHWSALKPSGKERRETVLACLAPPHSLHITVIPRAGARIPAHTALGRGCPLLLACESRLVADPRDCTTENFLSSIQMGANGLIEFYHDVLLVKSGAHKIVLLRLLLWAFC